MATEFALQYFDQEWQSYVNVEDYSILQDRTKLRTVSMHTQSRHSQGDVSSNATEVVANATQDVASDSSASTSFSEWPSPFVFPVKALSPHLVDALDKRINLCNPKQRYLRGLLLQTLCSEAVKFKTHPDHREKVEMAKSITLAFPHLKEPVGRGYDGWLASVVDCLKSTRRQLGVID